MFMVWHIQKSTLGAKQTEISPNIHNNNFGVNYC